MTETDTPELSMPQASSASEEKSSDEKSYEEFEIGQHKVPWFLWVFFTLIIAWASISWIKFFGY